MRGLSQPPPEAETFSVKLTAPVWGLAAGGFGTLDAGINALSIATRILPSPLLVQTARLLTPANRQAPIAAEIGFIGAGKHVSTGGRPKYAVRSASKPTAAWSNSATAAAH